MLLKQIPFYGNSYVRGGGAQAEKDRGIFGYYRINRQTPFTFRDLRLFGYGLEKESFIYVRYKSSDRYQYFE